ncbi:MAG TPA: hypothetical protein ENJ19_01005 [Gammaproteobacteria bacterium]|nr:hypothetical protein [Gammaproteobacteria bacterium]
MKKQFRAAIMLAGALCAGQAYAFDGERRGFVLGLGIGLHSTDIEDNGVPYSNIARDESPSGLMTSFRIGAGLGKHFLLYYTNDVAWFSEKAEDNLTIAALTGIGGAYYFKPQPGGPYLNAAFGWAGRVELADSLTDKDYTGTGFSLGVGYEFRKWLSVEARYVDMSLEHETFDVFTKDVSSLQLTFQATFY